MAGPNIKSLSVPELLALKTEIDRLLQSRRAELESQLAAIGGSAAARRHGSLKGTKVAAKYQDTEGNKWAGRGARPRWLVAAMKGGKKLEDFLIAKAAKPRKKKTAKS
jgi:DNA-binding protein H-NS